MFSVFSNTIIIYLKRLSSVFSAFWSLKKVVGNVFQRKKKRVNVR